MNRISLGLVVSLFVVMMQGCATYTTPAAGVNITALTDDDIAELMKVEPASSFPARIAVARVQASGYTSRTNNGYGHGRYSVVTTRDIEDESDFEKLSSLVMVGGVAPLSRLLLPPNLDSIKDLRLSAARLKTDLILIYSVDTAFHVEGTPLGPLSAITLGFLPNKKAFVSSTTSGVLIDVRTGFVYGVAEATEREEQRTTIWNSEDAIDEARMDSEKASFKSFVSEFEKLWKNTLAQYAVKKS
ncbi:hypothetical protein [Teredinibacter haidensis]|uniref:hypothetical protein n=1 Tax=Teredinibacter haidensis TaxID=2731755 RepID=UPI0009488BA0|nr:hypothetical protein [Teredinibacter haidensis]